MNNKILKGWLVRALFRAASVIVCVTIAVFFLIRIVPGDPAKMILGQYSTPEAISAMHHSLGLDLPLWEQFARFLKNIVLHGDTGTSIIYHVSARELILKSAPVTLLLILMAMVITIFAAFLLAVLAATHKDGILDHVIRILPAVTLGMPVFWVGLLLIMIFSVHFGWFPVGGTGSGIGETLYGLILPSVTVAFSQIPSLVRSLRAQILEVLGAEFVTTLQAAGIPERVILFRHVLRNSALPTIMLLGVNVSYLIGGTLVVEQVFDIKGVGSLLFTAISNRDFPVIQGVALYCAVAVVIISFLIELISRWLDPRTTGEG